MSQRRLFALADIGGPDLAHMPDEHDAIAEAVAAGDRGRVAILIADHNAGLVRLVARLRREQPGVFRAD
jgi:DNA-binding GntR family transcriptional regulator